MPHLTIPFVHLQAHHILTMEEFVCCDLVFHMRPHFVNADIAPGVKLSGGIVSHIINELNITCLPKDLPEFIEVDLKTLAAGHSIHLKDVVMPAGVRAVTHGNDNPVIAAAIVRGGAEEEAAADSPTAADVPATAQKAPAEAAGKDGKAAPAKDAKAPAKDAKKK